MKILFEHSDGTKTEIGTATNRQDAWKIIMDFLRNNGYKSRYQRVAMFPDEKRFWIDFGSHVCFIHIVDVTNDEYKEFAGDLV